MPVNNPSGGSTAVTILEDNSRTTEDPITEYPTGVSYMPSTSETDDEDQFTTDLGTGVIETIRFHNPLVEEEGGVESGIQVFHADYQGGGRVRRRVYKGDIEEWLDWRRESYYPDLDSRPSVFPPALHDLINHSGINGDPDEGTVITIIDGVPTWAAP